MRWEKTPICYLYKIFKFCSVQKFKEEVEQVWIGITKKNRQSQSLTIQVYVTKDFLPVLIIQRTDEKKMWNCVTDMALVAI